MAAAWEIQGRDALTGGAAGPFQSNPVFGSSVFADGPFQVGGAGNFAYQPESVSAPTTAQGQRLPADLGSALRGSSSSLASVGGSSTWLMLAGLALAAVYFLRHQ